MQSLVHVQNAFSWCMYNPLSNGLYRVAYEIEIIPIYIGAQIMYIVFVQCISFECLQTLDRTIYGHGN